MQETPTRQLHSDAAWRKWHALAPLCQPVSQCAWNWPARTVRVEHLLVAMLFGFEDETPYLHWLESYPGDHRAWAKESREIACGRAAFVLRKLGVDVERLQRDVWEAAQLEPAREIDVPARHSRDFRRVWQLAFEEARTMGSPQVWPEHLLLAILRWGQPRSSWSVWPLRPDRALQVLEGLQIDLGVARVLVRDLLGEEIQAPSVFSIRVEKVVAHAHNLSIKTHCGRIAPTHLLLALLRDEEGARDALKYLGVPDVNLEAVREDVRNRIASDAEASGATPRFSKDSARVLDKSKAMARRAGWRVIDEPLLLLNLAIHGGEQTRALLQVLGGEVGRLQVLGKRLYSRSRVRTVSADDGKMASGVVNWVAFLTAPICWPLGFVLLLTGPKTPMAAGPGVPKPTLLAIMLIAIPMLWMAASIFALLLGRPAKFKRACESFLSGLGVTFILYFGLSVAWHLLQTLLSL